MARALQTSRRRSSSSSTLRHQQQAGTSSSSEIGIKIGTETGIAAATAGSSSSSNLIEAGRQTGRLPAVLLLLLLPHTAVALALLSSSMVRVAEAVKIAMTLTYSRGMARLSAKMDHPSALGLLTALLLLLLVMAVLQLVVLLLVGGAAAVQQQQRGLGTLQACGGGM